MRGSVSGGQIVRTLGGIVVVMLRSLLYLVEMAVRRAERGADDADRGERGEPFGHMHAERFGDHEGTEEADRGHGAVLQPAILVDLVDALDGQLTDDERADAV